MPRTAANSSDDQERDASTVVENDQVTAPPVVDAEPTPAARPSELFWIGPMTPDGRPAEFFGGSPGIEPIPPRDLAADDVAALTAAQWELVESATGQRLYAATKPEPSAS